MSSLLNDLYRGAIRTAGFFVKEVVTVLRQPRLLGGLVLGPFVLLLLFGLGYKGQSPEFQTILVVPNNPAVSDQIESYRDAFTGPFKLREVTRDQQHAQQELHARQADVVVVVPDNILDALYNGQRASLQVLYDETDPTQSAWVRYFAYVQTSELNRRVLIEVIKQSKGPAAQLLEFTGQVNSETDGLAADVRSGNSASASARAARLLTATQSARTGIAVGLDALSNDVAAPTSAGSGPITARLNAFEQELVALQGDLARGPAGQASAQQRAANLQSQANDMDTMAQRLNQIPPETLVSPFESDARNALGYQPTEIAFYTPAVLALLLQHMGVMLGALSSVRDRLLGTAELFRVSPVGPGNILVGKTLGYGLLLAIVGLILSVCATRFLKVPFLGGPLDYWLSVALVIFASVGLGFALSVFAQSESQAVQLSMLVLLASVFFGGFFLPIDQLFEWVRPLSYVLPVTYGTIDLREVMLRGAAPSLVHLLGPLALGLVFYVVAIAGLGRQMRRA
jgi:ABC-2 type transport system permease protein